MRSYLVLVSAIFCVACGSDNDETKNVGTDVASDAGSDAEIDVQADVQADASEDVRTDADSDGPIDALTNAPQDVAQATTGTALFAASNFATTTEMVAVDMGQPAVLGRLLSDDQDSIVDADEGLGFLLRRSVDEIYVLDGTQPSNVKHTIDISPEAGIANPWEVVVPAGTKAYVIRYGQNTLSVIDPQAGTRLGEIDLSAYSIDADGLVDAFAGVFDATTGRAYVGLQRADQYDHGIPPDYVHSCDNTHPVIVGIDTSNDSVVDLNGTAPGEALELEGYNPWRLRWDSVNNRVIVLSVGCAVDGNAGTTRARRGVEAVDPSAGTSSWLWQSDGIERPAELLWLSDTDALVALDDGGFIRHWYAWNPTSIQLGAELTGVPAVPVWDGQRGLLGLAFGTTTLDVVRYDLDDGQTVVLLPDAFTTTGVIATSSARLH